MEAMLANINMLLVHSAGKALGATYAQLLRNRHLHNLWSFFARICTYFVFSRKVEYAARLRRRAGVHWEYIRVCRCNTAVGVLHTVYFPKDLFLPGY